MVKMQVSELDSIFKAISDMDGEMEIEKNDEMVKITKGVKHFEAHRVGRVVASMPLHSFETKSASSIEIEGNVIKVNFDKGKYVFRV